MKLKNIHEEAKRCIKNNFWKLFFITLLNAIIAVAFTKISENFETYIFKIIFIILSYAITVPLSYGVIVSYMKNSNNESFSAFDFISDGMKSFKRVWAVFGRTLLKLIVPLILVIVGWIVSIMLFSFAVFNAINGSSSGTLEITISAILIIATTIFYIVKSLSYSLTSYILYDNPDFSAKEIVEESAILMKGNKMSLVIVSLYLIVLYVILFAACSLIMTLIPTFIGGLITIVLMLATAIILLPYSMGLQIAFYNLVKNGTSTDTNSKVIQNNEN